MKKLLSFVIVTLMIVSAVIPAFALSEAPAAPDPAENTLNIWAEDAVLNLSESQYVSVYFWVTDNTDGFEFLKWFVVYPNCLTLANKKTDGVDGMTFVGEDEGGFTSKDDLEASIEQKTVSTQFKTQLQECGYNAYEVLGIDPNTPPAELKNATGSYKYTSPLLVCEREDAYRDPVDCFDNGRAVKITFKYDATLNTEFGDTIPIRVYNSPDDQNHADDTEWGDELVNVIVHDGVITINSEHVHKPGEPVSENVVPATTEAPGSYDKVVYCTGCGEELSRETITVYYYPTVKVSDETIDKGDATAEFTVELFNNPGFYGTYLYFIYDKELSFVDGGFTAGSLGTVPLSPNDEADIRNVNIATYKKLNEIKSDFEAAGVDYTDKLMVVAGIEGQSLKENITGDGVLFKVKLNTADLDSGEYDINIVYGAMNTRDVDDNPVTFDLVQGKLTVTGCEHDFTAEVVGDDYLVSEADCQHAATYYRSCTKCGASSEDENNTFTFGDLGEHNFEAEVAEDEFLVEEANCQHPAIYRLSCTVCGAPSEDDDDTFEYGELGGHDFTAEVVGDDYLAEEAKCETPAKYYRSCSVCGASCEDENNTFEYGESAGHSYESVVTPAECGVPGYTTHTCSKCGHTYTDNETDPLQHEFTNETVDDKYLKSAADCVNPAVYYKSCWRCGASSNDDNYTFTYGEPTTHNFVAEVAEATYLKSEADCLNPAVYYKSCTGCGLASETETFESGEALGHEFTNETAAPDYLKSEADCLNPAVYYKSCWRCNAASTSDDDTFTVGKALGHEFTNETAAPDYLKSEADCLNPAVYYKSCWRCGAASTSDEDTFEYGEPNGHRFTKEVIDDDHLKTPADCTNAAVYFYTCEDCGAISETDTFEYGEPNGHRFIKEVIDDDHLKSAADCTNAAVYFYTCEDCGAISNDDNYTFTVGTSLGHNFKAETATAKYLKSEADCLNPAVYYKSCTRCGLASETDTFEYGQALGHDFTDEVAQEKYLKTPADCTNPAVYYKSCKRCHIASETDTFNYGTANGHTFTDEIAEPRYLKSPADCENPAVYYKSCKDCGEPSNDDALTFTVGDPLGHDYQNGTDVEITLDPENIQNKLTLRVCSRGDCAIDQNTNTEYDVEVIQPTCTKEGCTRYINRTTEEVIVDPNSVTDMIPHNFLPGVPVPPSCTEKGYTPYTCTVGGEIENRDFVDALGHAWSEGVVTKEATATEEGEKTFTCTRCGATKTETIPKTDGSKQTGDNIMTIIFIATIALVSGAAVMVAKKKVFNR